jgi:hypothetical protein
MRAQQGVQTAELQQPDCGENMLDSTTELLSYALFLFLGYVYLPYTLFKFGAERKIDLGRRRDFTQLEEIIAGFVPTFFLHLQTLLFYRVTNRLLGVEYTIDFSVIASMFGRDRGAVSDYLYVGRWPGFLLYLGELWALSAVNGSWFGRAVAWIAKNDVDALHGLDLVRGRRPEIVGRNALVTWVLRNIDWLRAPAKGTQKLPRRLYPAWWFWYSFFHESVVPLFAWAERGPEVRVETTDHRVYYGRFVRYEKTTDGRLDAIRLRDVKRVLYDDRNRLGGRRTGDPKKVSEALGPFETELMAVGTLYLKWAQVSDVAVLPGQEKTAEIRTLLNPDPARLQIKDKDKDKDAVVQPTPVHKPADPEPAANSAAVERAE